jgi:hypothetical protein
MLSKVAHTAFIFSPAMYIIIPMLTGFNTNVPYKGKTFHVQTEDTGESSATVTTLLYYQGTILSRKSFTYKEQLGDADWKDKVSAMMKQQHITMIKELLSGAHSKEEA